MYQKTALLNAFWATHDCFGIQFASHESTKRYLLIQCWMHYSKRSFNTDFIRYDTCISSWWRYVLDKFSAWMARCQGTPPDTDSPHREPVMQILDVLLCHKLCNKQFSTGRRWFKNTWRPRDATLTHWGRVTHICVGKLTIIGSDNGLSPQRRQAIIWTNAGILLIGPLGTNFSEILIEIQTFSFKKMHFKMSSAKWRLFGLGLNVLMMMHVFVLDRIATPWRHRCDD